MATRRRRAPRFVTVVLGGLALTLTIVTVLPVIALRWIRPPTTSFILQQRFAGPSGHRGCDRIERKWVDWSNVSPHVPIAVVAAEDQRFPTHRGFDLDAIVDAVEERLESGRVRGASTISQQLAKNLFLWPGRSWLRKGLEAYLTALIELCWPKRRILEVYLNVAQFGPCTFGVGAASERFFGKTASSLDAREAALLAAVLPAPARSRLDRPLPYTEKRARWVRNQVSRLGGPAYLRDL